MKEIKLTQGKITFVDDDDFDYLNQFKWHASKDKENYYATRSGANKKGTKIRMHREILNLQRNEIADHKDGNSLNNQKENLRICSYSENQRNKKKSKNKSSIYKGVTIQKNKYCVSTIRVNKKLIYLGCFKTEKEAAKVYNEAAIKYFGNFVKLNRI